MFTSRDGNCEPSLEISLKCLHSSSVSPIWAHFLSLSWTDSYLCGCLFVLVFPSGLGMWLAYIIWFYFPILSSGFMKYETFLLNSTGLYICSFNYIYTWSLFTTMLEYIRFTLPALLRPPIIVLLEDVAMCTSAPPPAFLACLCWVERSKRRQ